MKKILSMMLSLVLLLNLSITVFAEEDTVASASDAQSATGQDITDTGITYPEEQPEMISETGEDSVINIEITWGTMNFIYSDKIEDNSEEGWSWTDDVNTVKITNNGTVSVKAECSYKQDDGYLSITSRIEGESKILSENDNATFKLMFEGKPKTALNGVSIGSLTVTITNADNQSNAVAIADEDAEETGEGAENETDNSNTALEEEPNDTDTVENVQDDKETTEGTENGTDDQNTTLEGEPNATDTVTDIEEDSEDGDETDEGAENGTDDQNPVLNEEPNDTDMVTDVEEDVKDGGKTDEGAENETDDLNAALNEEQNDMDIVMDTVGDTKENEEVSSEIGDEEQITE